MIADIVKLVVLAQDLITAARKIAKGAGTDGKTLNQLVEEHRKEREAAFAKEQARVDGVFGE